jgi:hypothetical protein
MCTLLETEETQLVNLIIPFKPGIAPQEERRVTRKRICEGKEKLRN